MYSFLDCRVGFIIADGDRIEESNRADSSRVCCCAQMASAGSSSRKGARCPGPEAADFVEASFMLARQFCTASPQNYDAVLLTH